MHSLHLSGKVSFLKVVIIYTNYSSFSAQSCLSIKHILLSALVPRYFPVSYDTLFFSLLFMIHHLALWLNLSQLQPLGVPNAVILHYVPKALNSFPLLPQNNTLACISHPTPEKTILYRGSNFL